MIAGAGQHAREWQDRSLRGIGELKGRMRFHVGWGHSREGDRFFLGAGSVF